MSRSETRPVEEEQLIGEPLEEVPKIDPDQYCNSRSTDRNEEGESVFSGYCSLRAGWGTDHVGEGRCRLHGGSIEGAGAPEHNQNAQTHALNADPCHYHQSLDEEGKEFVRDVSATIEDRLRARSGDVDYMDRVLARRVAIKLHIVSKATDYIENVTGLVQTISTEHSSYEEKAPLLSEIRQYDKSIMQDLQKLGVLDDPESQKADALEEWRGFIEGGQ
jgi:hypothetical protein